MGRRTLPRMREGRRNRMGGGTSIALVMGNQSKLDYREKCSHLEGLLPVWDRGRACIF